MALRELTDSDGTLWQIWNVKPTTRYSSPLARADRRVKTAAHFYPDRRKGGFTLTPGLERGWLCFECDREKRRLVPAPRDWETCSEGTLSAYLRAAKPIRRRIIDEGESVAAPLQTS
jgi:hypothetical protein